VCVEPFLRLILPMSGRDTPRSPSPSRAKRLASSASLSSLASTAAKRESSVYTPSGPGDLLVSCLLIAGNIDVEVRVVHLEPEGQGM